MKTSILLLTILGMITINVVTGGPIEDPKQEASSENVNKNADVSDVDVLSRRKRSSNGCCWKVEVAYSETHHVQREQSEIFQYYKEEPELVNGRTHYTSDDGTRAIWFEGSDWNIGLASDRGGNTVVAYSPSNGRSCPDELAYTWKYAIVDDDDGSFRDADEGLGIWCESYRESDEM